MPDIKQQGMALVLALVFMVILAGLGAGLLTQSLTGVKVSAGLRDYEKTFQLADGACQRSIGWVTSQARFGPTHDDPSQTGSPVSSLPGHMNTKIAEPGANGEKTLAKVTWEGYDTRPLPGWMINWQGYSNFFRANLKAVGVGELDNREGNSTVSALMIRIQR
ncbi:MAG: pilus assembly PilX N-terminal domain-containing protein [Desulfohalobiaceae bacterium]|nr:pilus assembly PilX N-terminal domain-containing protein [Desulfohalobiaceae bacterium]